MKKIFSRQLELIKPAVFYAYESLDSGFLGTKNRFREPIYPCLPPLKNQGNHKKSYMVIYENMPVIKRPYYSMILCKSYTVP